MFERILKCIEEYDTIIIHRHKNPDGDALGSQIGLKHLISENYPEKRVLCVGDASERYGFMDDSTMDDVSDEEYSGALAIVLDTSAKALIYDDRYTTAGCTARIDHHIFCEEIAEIEVTDTSFESCCGMIAAMAQECGWRLTPIAAKSLYTGMVTDSGRFRYDSTTPKTFRLAAYLMEQEFSTADIYRNLYADDFDFIKLRAQFVLKIQFCENRKVTYIYTTAEEAKDYGVDTFTISRGMVNTMGEIRGVDIWVNFTEADEGVFTEIRSSIHNINPIAKKYGGGGHAKASGATLKNKEEAMQLLQDLIDLSEGAV
jgi:phosphoesterase RecJ-like protein